MASCVCNTKVNYSDYYSDTVSTWCTNCGNYGIAAATKRALVLENLPPHEVLLCYDIGCNGNGADKIQGYRFHGLHGRVIPFASGAALANNKLKVIASAGDGATLSEGINHLVHAIRCNYNVTFLLHNNGAYALTTGQASNTTRWDIPMNASPDGITANPIHFMHFVLGLKPSFAARTFSGDIHQMTEIFRAGIQHQGFAVIEILQSCPTYNKEITHEWLQQRVYDVGSIPGYEANDLAHAMEVSADLDDKIATGILYKDERMLDFYHRQANRAEKITELVEEVQEQDISELVKAFR